LFHALAGHLTRCQDGADFPGKTGLLALTFVRTAELIGARRSEFDFKAARWKLPAKRMKMKTPHIVPLSRQSLEVLGRLRAISQ
jgi:integrase